MLRFTPVLLVLSFGFAGQAAAADETAELWKSKCSNCHGVDGKGQTKIGKRMQVGDATTAEWQKKHTDEAMKKRIVEGLDTTVDGVKKKMDAYKDLKPEQIDALVKLMRAFAPKEAAAPQ